MGGGFWGDFANRQARHECSASPQLAAEIIADKSKRKVNLRVSLELDEVAPAIQQRGGATGEQNAMSRKPAATPTDTPTANPSEILAKFWAKSQGKG